MYLIKFDEYVYFHGIEVPNPKHQLYPDSFYSSDTFKNLDHKYIISILISIVLIEKINFAIFNNS